MLVFKKILTCRPSGRHSDIRFLDILVVRYLKYKTIMSDSIQWDRSSFDGSCPQYERTWMKESLVCRLCYQTQRRVAIFLNDNR